ncbi:MAG: hypothetical protein OXH94_06410 [Rhodospirillales bacterium]|nr:hypothetical protein [Rhodospirillales bacterium]
MFGITGARNFLEKVQQDYSEVKKDIADPSLAMNCILSSYHLHEWVWARWLKGNVGAQQSLGVTGSKEVFLDWLDSNCPYFMLVQELANGTKHCAPVHSTENVAGYGVGPFGVGPFGEAYLLIDLGDDHAADERYLVASTVLGEVVSFWTEFFDINGILD